MAYVAMAILRFELMCGMVAENRAGFSSMDSDIPVSAGSGCSPLAAADRPEQTLMDVRYIFVPNHPLCLYAVRTTVWKPFGGHVWLSRALYGCVHAAFHPLHPYPPGIRVVAHRRLFLRCRAAQRRRIWGTAPAPWRHTSTAKTSFVSPTRAGECEGIALCGCVGRVCV